MIQAVFFYQIIVRQVYIVGVKRPLGIYFVPPCRHFLTRSYQGLLANIRVSLGKFVCYMLKRCLYACNAQVQKTGRELLYKRLLLSRHMLELITDSEKCTLYKSM